MKSYLVKHFLKLIFAFVVAFFASCTEKNSSQTESQLTSDSLHKMMAEYAPGLGEIMGGIQMHHAKLWYAGINDNWELAQYEIDELKERFVQATQVETTRPEVKMIPMMYPPIDSLKDAIARKNIDQFKSSYKLLTATCNSCHQANNFSFNIITIPTAPPVTNQDFKAQ
jgi:hypothetical protein